MKVRERLVMWYFQRLMFAGLCICALAAFCLHGAAVAGQGGARFGGPCAYESYPGVAEILSVKELPADEATGRRRFDVRFAFFPDRKVKQRFAQTGGREFLLLLDFTRYPDEKDVETYGLETGAKVKGVMRVIVKGTCTPVLFDFPRPGR
jgi:hypothetical protein